MAKFDKTIIGKKFGKLTVTDEYESGRNGTYWKCICDCGNELFVYRGKLTTGHTKSCGCKTRTLNGLSKHPLYGTWWSMKERCYSAKHPSYDNYGGRGIKISSEWFDDFISFYDWAIKNGYKEGLSIDRIDNDGDYSPRNCQWITIAENTAKANKETVRRKTKYTYWGLSPAKEYYEFPNAAAFARENNLSGDGLRAVARGERHSYKEWVFGYTNKINN